MDATRRYLLAIILVAVRAGWDCDRAAGQPFFTSLPSATTGVTFTNPLTFERALTNQIFLNGSGVAAGDVDGDGRVDLFFAGFSGASALWRNVGLFRFTNITASAGLASLTNFDATGAALADVDGDGSLDLVVNTVGQGTWVFINDGSGRFTRKAPLNLGRGGSSLALADVDGDGALDLYVANYRRETMRDDPGARFVLSGAGGREAVTSYNGRPTTNADLVGRFRVVKGKVLEQGEPHAFYLNDGRGNFRPVPWNQGAFLDAEGRPLTEPYYDWGLSCVFRDLNGDGRPDLYVCNDFESPDRLWINESTNGLVRFRLAPWQSRAHQPAFSMGVDVADINRDGRDDFLVVDMLSRDHRLRTTQVDGLPPGYAFAGVWDDQPQFSMNMLYLANGDGTFSEISRLAGLAASEWSWCPVFLDVDLDGYEDLLVSNGHLLDLMDADVADAGASAAAQRRLTSREILEQRRQYPRLNAQKAAFRNRGNLTFEDVSASWGFQADAVTHGMALADLDGDGALDVVVNSLQGPALIFRNNAAAPRLAVRLRGRRPNTRGIGARILVRGGPVPEQSQVIQAGGRYLSSDDPMRVFAAGAAKDLEVEVRWPSGRRTLLSRVTPNQTLSITEPADPPLASLPAKRSPPPLFEEVSSNLGHVDPAVAFDDFGRQPLLPRKWSAAGPSATWTDINGDGWDDLVMGANAGGRLTLWTNVLGRSFAKSEPPVVNRPLGRTLTTIVPVHTTLLAGSSNYRDGVTNGGLLRVIDPSRGINGESLGGQGITVGPVALADVETNRSLWLFIGGRSTPGRWPEPADSLLVRFEAGKLAVQQRLERLGNVTAACFADLDGDGADDLIAACDWGPIRVFHNEHGRFLETTTSWGLAGFTGWWNSVAVGDFDEDGRLDIIAGNWGWNQFPSVAPPDPSAAPPTTAIRRCWYGDISGAGGVDVVESYVDAAGREWPFRRVDTLLAAFPEWRVRYPTRAAFGSATVPQLLGDAAARLTVLEARWFATTVFLNRKGRFEERALPVEAQFSPVFGLAVADFDGDGHQDVFLAQNFFGLPRDQLRQDAGRGLLLTGDGRGNFNPMSSLASGIAFYGEGRAAAVCDFDHDGRPDLAVTQEGGPTHLLHNVGGRPGLRTRLGGSAAAPLVAGALLRGVSAAGPGPVFAVSAGSGHQSVDSPEIVVTGTQPLQRLEVRWPGYGWRRYEIPVGANDLTVNPDGSAKAGPSSALQH